ncbi:unnamed protein product [Rhizoctonia solani]|uniref:Uncharacterized protein n=1 Tax=Rhizoctonia solani TaxID=456999 RepID=A0A8H2WJ21_9AGAM|nr:unnamed protein product [Rhizoctonia solani]
MFARDDRPVPNIVAIYERPRHKIRRDATHLLGGMFGWNTAEEMARALRREDSPVEESTPTIASTPEPITADASPSGLPQRCAKRSSKRNKRRALVPLAEMGASILSLSLQERMRRQRGGDEKEDNEPVSALVKFPKVSVDITATAADSTATMKKIKVTTSGDVPTTKKLRLTISAAPPASIASLSTPSLQLLSPPDTSSNASKAPADERYAIPISSSTPGTGQLPMPNFELDLSSESSSESSSDSPDLSSSTSTHSAPQNKARGKQRGATVSISNKSRTTTPVAATSQPRNPSTPPRRKRQAHQPGWVGWVQTEESPDHSRLIRLDDVPVILGRRTRSGKEFADPPLRRRSIAPSDPKRQMKPPVNSGRTGQKSKQQSAWQEAQKRGRVEESVRSKGDGEHASETAEPSHNNNQVHSSRTRRSQPVALAKSGGSVTAAATNSGDTSLTSKLEQTSLGGLTKASQPVRGDSSSATKSAKVLATSQSSSISVPAVLKLTRSDTVITPTGARSNAPEHKEVRPVKDSPSEVEKARALADLPIRALPTSASARKDVVQTNSEKAVRSGAKGTAQSHSKDISRPVSRSALGTSYSSTLINGAKLESTNSSPDSAFKKSPASVMGSGSRSMSMSGMTEKALAVPRNPLDKPKITKVGGMWSNALKSSPNPGGLNDMVSSASFNTNLKSASSTSKTTKPFPMPSRIERNDLDSKHPPFSLLGKRKDSPSPLPSGQSSSSSQSRIKKRKLAMSSSDESEGPRFNVNPFDRRAKQMELTRKGVSGEAFQSEMKRWIHEKKAEWKEKERQKEKQKEKQKERSSGNELRTAIAEGKPVSEAVRHRLAGSSTSTRIGDAKLARKKAWSTEWGMDVAKVSVAGNSEKRTHLKSVAEVEKRDPRVKDAHEFNVSYVALELDAAREFAKLKRVAS